MEHIHCDNCGYEGKSKKNFSFLMFFSLIGGLFFPPLLLAALVFFILRICGFKYSCPDCGSYKIRSYFAHQKLCTAKTEIIKKETIEVRDQETGKSYLIVNGQVFDAEKSAS
jgi:hypothetical protein